MVTELKCKAKLSRFSNELCNEPAKIVKLVGPLGDFEQTLCDEHIYLAESLCKYSVTDKQSFLIYHLETRYKRLSF